MPIVAPNLQHLGLPAHVQSLAPPPINGPTGPQQELAASNWIKAALVASATPALGTETPQKGEIHRQLRFYQEQIQSSVPNPAGALAGAPAWAVQLQTNLEASVNNVANHVDQVENKITTLDGKVTALQTTVERLKRSIENESIIRKNVVLNADGKDFYGVVYNDQFQDLPQDVALLRNPEAIRNLSRANQTRWKNYYGVDTMAEVVRKQIF